MCIYKVRSKVNKALDVWSASHCLKYRYFFCKPLRRGGEIHLHLVIHQQDFSAAEARQCPARVTLYPARMNSSRLTLQLGLGDFPAGLGGCDGGGAGRIHERSLQHARPVLLARRQIALPPSLEVVLAFSYSGTQRKKKNKQKNQILN